MTHTRILYTHISPLTYHITWRHKTRIHENIPETWQYK